MILKRLGNKQAIANDVIGYFPQHSTYIEPFFGAGGIYFNKPKAKYNLLNDVDSDVFNLFQVIRNQKNELEQAFYAMPIHTDLLKYWKTNKETEPINKALRFLLLSNFTYLGKQDTIRLSIMDCNRGEKERFNKLINETNEKLYKATFGNFDFRIFLSNIGWHERRPNFRKRTFIYADPPYLNTTSTYSDNGWNEKDLTELFEKLIECDCNFALSEFENDIILEMVKKYNLNIITVGEKRNLKNMRIEILITNYENAPTLF